MGVYEGSGQLSKALRQLLVQWEDARLNWNDAQAREFEEKYLIPLQNDLRNASSAMSRMAALLEKIRRDCE